MAEPKHGTQPIRVEETSGKKAYCTCGRSEKLPYCDGSHNRLSTGCKPVKLILAEAEAGTRWICQCHQSRNMPWCDGTHNTLKQA
jgi:CDGSH-type Zn-finger protein